MVRQFAGRTSLLPRDAALSADFLMRTLWRSILRILVKPAAFFFLSVPIIYGSRFGSATSPDTRDVPFLPKFRRKEDKPVNKHRKQLVDVLGQKRLVEVPVDDELYKIDRRDDYLNSRAKIKHVALDDRFIANQAPDVADTFERAQLLEHLRKALLTLDEDELLLVECYYYGNRNEHETAVRMKLSQSTVNRMKHKVIQKLRIYLSDWL
jgi:RNA polymerase sigma factor (sigma-70 family)